jgi:hypothetical protein
MEVIVVDIVVKGSALKDNVITGKTSLTCEPQFIFNAGHPITYFYQSFTNKTILKLFQIVNSLSIEIE